MAENNASDVRLNTNSNGMVYFASDVVATIAGLAVTEVEGVANTVGASGGLTEIFMRRALSNSRNLTRGIKVEISDNAVAVDVTIVVEYGFPVPEVAQGIQENVKKAIETMTGMSVKSVDVHVTGVSFERENRAVAELEMNQRKLLGKEAPESRSEEVAEPTPEADEAEEGDGEYTLDLEDVEDDEETKDGDAEEAAAEENNFEKEG